jgi:hypothetical protein
MENLRRFIDESKTFAGFTFQGVYTMDTDVFMKLYDHYLKTGENHLDTYTSLTWLTWDNQTRIKNMYAGYPKEFAKYIHDPDKCAELERCVKVSERLSLFDQETNLSLIQLITRYRNEYTEFLKKNKRYLKQTEAPSGIPTQKVGPD